MCGICGVIVHSGASPKQEKIKKMVQTMKHRGPDDEGYFFDSNIGLGMCRLAVLDIAGGHQPMSLRSKKVQVIFNGEIFNYPELRSALERKGYKFKTHCDTEILAYLYEEEGEFFARKLRGMFAIALWDGIQQKLFLIRDHIGIKPLYYSYLQGKNLVFGSEIKTILEWIKEEELDPASLLSFFSLLYIPSPGTIYQNISQVPPAHMLTWHKGQIQLKEFWKLSCKKKKWKNQNEAIESLKEKFEQTVKEQLASDVPLGVFLSGGIDSSAITAMMARHTSKAVKSFTLWFGEEASSYNECKWARIASDAFGTEHTELEVKPEILKLIPEIISHFDQPFADSSSLLTYLISEKAKEKVTVALTGIGGDELFGGYPRYQGILFAHWFDRLPCFIRKNLLFKAARFLPDSFTSYNFPGRLKRFLLGILLSDKERYLSWLQVVAKQDLERIFHPGFWQKVSAFSPVKAHHSFFNESKLLNVLDRIFFTDLKTYLPDNLLALADRMSMAHGLELRVPFCDLKLVELSYSLPAAWKVQPLGLKVLFKKAMKPILPKPLLQHRKQGFMLPVGRWLQTKVISHYKKIILGKQNRINPYLNLKGIQAIFLEHERGVRNHGDLIFALIVFDQWLQLFNRKIKKT